MGVQAGSVANKVAGAVIAVLVIAAVVVLAVLRLGAVESTQLCALVHDGDGAVHEISLSRDSETAITTGLGTNVVVVEDGVVSIREADCDNHDCIRQGGIDAPGKQIICLPHKLWIEVAAEGGEAGQMDESAVAGSKDGFDVIAR